MESTSLKKNVNDEIRMVRVNMMRRRIEQKRNIWTGMPELDFDLTT